MGVEIKQEGRFVLYEGDQKAGYMTYKWDNYEQITADHTVVDKAFGGKGYATKLFAQLVTFARQKNVKVVPECSFVQRMFDKSDEYKDIDTRG